MDWSKLFRKKENQCKIKNFLLVTFHIVQQMIALKRLSENLEMYYLQKSSLTEKAEDQRGLVSLKCLRQMRPTRQSRTGTDKILMDEKSSSTSLALWNLDLETKFNPSRIMKTKYLRLSTQIFCFHLKIKNDIICLIF